MKSTNATKERLLDALNTVLYIKDYDAEDCIFSDKYGISSTNMVYILLNLEKNFNFKINDNFIDAMEMCSFSKFEESLEQFSD